jgi:hypothetical protein
LAAIIISLFLSGFAKGERKSLTLLLLTQGKAHRQNEHKNKKKCFVVTISYPIITVPHDVTTITMRHFFFFFKMTKEICLPA